MTFETVAVLLVLLAQETGHQDDAAAPEPSEALFGAYPMTRESMGTSWQPDSAPMEGIHFAAGGFDMMLHNVGVATQVPTFSGFPLGVTSGTYSELFDLTLASSWNPAFITANGGTTAAAEARLTPGLDQGQAYFNIHTSFRTGGEIRGFLAQVPEPGAIGLIVLGLGALAAAARKRRA